MVLRKLAESCRWETAHPVCKGWGEQQPHTPERRCKTSFNRQRMDLEGRPEDTAPLPQGECRDSGVSWSCGRSHARPSYWWSSQSNGRRWHRGRQRTVESAGRLATTRPVEVGCRGFVGSSTARLLGDMRCTGAACQKATKELAEEAEEGQWRRRKHRS